jgi:F-type H+-transporting ATPase subunit b
MLLSIDGTFLAQILNFVLFWVLLNVLFIAPTRRAIEKRQQQIAEQHRLAAEARAEASALQAEAAAILDEARRRTHEVVRDAAARATAEGTDLERRALEEAAATVASAHTKVAGERAEASAKQGRFIDELARSMALRALGAESVA